MLIVGRRMRFGTLEGWGSHESDCRFGAQEKGREGVAGKGETNSNRSLSEKRRG